MNGNISIIPLNHYINTRMFLYINLIIYIKKIIYKKKSQYIPKEDKLIHGYIIHHIVPLLYCMITQK
jgi:hypothetical protein